MGCAAARGIWLSYLRVAHQERKGYSCLLLLSLYLFLLVCLLVCLLVVLCAVEGSFHCSSRGVVVVQCWFFRCSSRGVWRSLCSDGFFHCSSQNVYDFEAGASGGQKGALRGAPLCTLPRARGAWTLGEKVSWGWCGCDLVPSLHPHALPIDALGRTVRGFLSD